MTVQETSIYVLTGMSPCPNDTFMFHALTHGHVSETGLVFEPMLEDIEALNRRAVDAQDRLSVTKLSVPALARVSEDFTILSAGAALGRGVGPLVVAREEGGPASLSELAGRRVAAPGELTTANLLLRVFAPTDIDVVQMRFDEVMPAVRDGQVDAGVVIHEGRFTFGGYGLARIQDLGQAWEDFTGLPLALGVICGHRGLGERVLSAVENGIRASIEHARAHPEDSWAWIRANAQEMDEDVCRQHIELYVNDYSLDLGDEGRRAIEALLQRGREVGALPASRDPWR